LKNNERTLKENESVQKKLLRFIDELTRSIAKNKLRRTEVIELTKKYRREYEMKKEQAKSVLQSLRELDEGKELNLAHSVGLKD
jgi:hypothetical protein